jgi:hypothetical protein
MTPHGGMAAMNPITPPTARAMDKDPGPPRRYAKQGPTERKEHHADQPGGRDGTARSVYGEDDGCHPGEPRAGETFEPHVAGQRDRSGGRDAEGYRSEETCL